MTTHEGSDDEWNADMMRGGMDSPNSRMYLAGVAIIFLLALVTMKSSFGDESLSARTLAPYTERVATGFIDWGYGFAQVHVVATYDTVRFGSSHAKIKSIDEANKKADNALYRLVRGINLDGEQRLAGHPDLEAALKKVIPKTRKREIGKIANTTLNATYTIPLAGKTSVSGFVRTMRGKGEPLAPVIDPGDGGDHTSVVFDASGTSLQAALFPRVLTEDGQLVYDETVIDPKIVARVPVARYVVRAKDSGKKKSGLSKDVARALGDNPLVVKVNKISGVFLADIILGPDQVAQLREAHAGNLLAQGLVFILQTGSVDMTD
ncbi:MAG: hypothetical protein ACE5IK_05425 [Acidobacteriota bacterium]